MIEFLSGIVTGYLLTGPMLIGLLIFGIIFEHNEARGWVIFTAIVSVVLAFFYFSIPLQTIAIYSVAYLAFGLVWSFYRYKRWVDAKVAFAKANNYGDGDRRAMANALAPARNLSTIVGWIVVWPFSAVDSIAGDLINAIEMLVKKVFKGVYNRIYESAVNELLTK